MRPAGLFFASNCCPVNFYAERQRAFVAQERLVCYNNTVIMGLQAKNAALQTKNRANVRERQGAVVTPFLIVFAISTTINVEFELYLTKVSQVKIHKRDLT